MRHRSPHPRARRALVAAALLAVVGSGVVGGRATVGGSDAPPRQRYLAAALEAARSDELYLVFHPEEPSLDLAANGLVLRRFPLLGARFGVRRFGPADAWPAVAFRLPEELPVGRRPRLPTAHPAPAPTANDGARPSPPGPTAPPEGAAPDPATEDLVRLRQEWIDSAPTRFQVVLDPPLVLAVVGRSASPGPVAVVERTGRDLLRGLGRLVASLRDRPPPPRLEIELPAEEARRLYLALLPGMRFLVVPPAAPTPPSRRAGGAREDG